MSTLTAALTATLARRDADELAARVEAAISRITSGLTAMRIPADRNDPDIVLRACGERIKALEAAREEQHEAMATHAEDYVEDADLCGQCRDEVSAIGHDLRATPLDATPLADELAALRADLATLRERQQFLDGSADIANLQAERDALRADLATAAEVTARLTEERDAAQAHAAKLLNMLSVCHDPNAVAERDTLRAQRDAAVEALEKFTKVNVRNWQHGEDCGRGFECEDADATHPCSHHEDEPCPLCECGMSELYAADDAARAALLLARGTP